jgi:hypothetical protein
MGMGHRRVRGGRPGAAGRGPPPVAGPPGIGYEGALTMTTPPAPEAKEISALRAPCGHGGR